jgi:hypothetical protein
MTALALRRRGAALALWTSLVGRQRTLALYGAASLVLGVVAVGLHALDPRTLQSGIGVWVKPAKFFFSVGVFALTSAWFFGYMRADRRASRTMRATVAVLIATGTLELVYICWQAAHGLESHFNLTTPFYQMMYGLMGIAAVLLIGTTLPLAWQIGRHPAPGVQRSFIAAVVIGLVLTFLLGGGLGGYMSSQAGHSVGQVGGHVPVFGWNRLGGDLRVAHFLGIHAQQAIPMLAAMTAAGRARARWAVLLLGTIGYVVLTLAVFAQAVAGRPLLPG